MTDDVLRQWVQGHTPVPARLESWQRELLCDPEPVHALIRQYGSPVNLIDPSVLPGHADELISAAARHGVDLRVFYARKANKALSIVDAALAAGHGVDVASLAELQQVLDRGARPDDLIVTAAVKPDALLRLAIENDVVISVDNLDELAAIEALAGSAGRRPRLALRLMPELEGIAPSRFGLRRDEVTKILTGSTDRFRLSGLHFHLGGYRSDERAAMLDVALEVIDEVRAAGHAPEFIDIGGGVPMRYLDDPEHWNRFTDSCARRAEPLWNDKELGQLYPMWQDPVRGEWLSGLLSTNGIGERLAEQGLRLHLEPGRALLDGAGLTLARVVFRKQRSDGEWLVGLAMNRTQVRSAADDFILDPVLVPAVDRRPSEPLEAYLVGAYCIEDELITRRRLRFPHGVAVGDTIVFINTAGYVMHILESTSHQMPLANNVRRSEDGTWVLDPIDERD